MMREGIVSGYKDARGSLLGLYGPANPVTYGELAKMAVEASGQHVVLSSAVPRNRLASRHWSQQSIAAAEELRLSIFVPHLDPDHPATRGEVMQTILEAFRIPLRDEAPNPFRDLRDTHLHADAIRTAAALGILSGDTDRKAKATGTVRPNDSVNRAEVAKIIKLVQQFAE
jgi:hypothetical protein